MANKRLSMRNIRETLRLRLVADLSIRQISRSTRSSVGAVQKVLARASALKLEAATIESLSDAELLGLMYPKPDDVVSNFQPLDCLYLHQELKRKGVTKQLLWEEYNAVHGDRAYRYSQFCTIYRQWLKTQKRSMRQTHRAGEKCFVDYCGHTAPIINPESGEVRDVQIFVGVLGASNYTFAEATHSQKLADWLGSHVRMFDFFGGVPESVVPDNLRSAVSKSCRYDPELNPSYQQLAEHYDIAVLPARPYKPQDKAKAEVAVQIVERWILARLRKLRFFSLAELNLAISDLLLELNQRSFKRLHGNRLDAFTALDQPALRALPRIAYQYTAIKNAKVNIDYHVEYERHYYSVPDHFVGEKVEIHATASLVSVLLRGKNIASHPRAYTTGHSTIEAHMPAQHQKHNKWTPERLQQWALSIGVHTHIWISHQLIRRKHPEQAYKVCLGLLSLSRSYPAERLDAACAIATDSGLTRLSAIKNILINRRDQSASNEAQLILDLPQDHDNVRGPEQFH